MDPTLAALLQQLANGLVNGAAYVVIAMGLSLIFGVLRVVNFAHGEFFMLGAFATFYGVSLLGIGYLPSVVLSAAAMAALGAITYLLIFRPMLRHGEYGVTLVSYEFSVLLVSLGLSIFLINATLTIFGADPKIVRSPFANASVVFGSVFLDQQRILIFIAAALLVLAVQLMLKRTTFGKMMRATAQNREAAALVGINIGRVYMGTIALGTALAGIGGALVAPISVIYPDIGQPLLLKAFIVVIIGGLGSVWGAVAGGLLLGVTEAIGAAFVSITFRDAIGFAMIILVLLVRPSGLFGGRR